MRSELIFMAVTRESNRFKLARLAAKATRKLHWPNTRIQDTTNNVLQQLAGRSPGTVAELERS